MIVHCHIWQQFIFLSLLKQTILPHYIPVTMDAGTVYITSISLALIIVPNVEFPYKVMLLIHNIIHHYISRYVGVYYLLLLGDSVWVLGDIIVWNELL